MEALVPELVIDIWAAIVDDTYTDTTVQELLDQTNVEAQKRLDEAGVHLMATTLLGLSPTRDLV